MDSLEIKYRATSELRPREGNPRTHSKKQVEQIARSIKQFSFNNPVLIDKDDRIVAGHGRVEAARLIGMAQVPTVCLADMTEADIRAYVIADNRVAEQAGWDKELLAAEFKFLADLDDGFDLASTGFELAEIDAFLADSPRASKAAKIDAVPALGERAVTQMGDIWEIGTHRLVCGDATQAPSYAALLDTEKATMVFADPPYNVPINGHVSGLGKVRHREFAMASGEMTPDQFKNFLAQVFLNLSKYSGNGSIHYHCIDWRHARDMIEASAVGYSELKNICVWSKSNGGMGSLYRSAHEFVLVLKNGKDPHINNIELGKHGRFRTNVWNYPGANSFGATRDDDLAMHPTVKPVAMVYDAILDCSNRGDIVLDPFAGSGTTLVAAHKAKRRGFGIELDPLYCDVIAKRMQTLFKFTPRLAEDGRSFEQVATERGMSLDHEEAA